MASKAFMSKVVTLQGKWRATKLLGIPRLILLLKLSQLGAHFLRVQVFQGYIKAQGPRDRPRIHLHG